MTAVVTESGVLDAAALARLRAGIEFPGGAQAVAGGALRRLEPE